MLPDDALRAPISTWLFELQFSSDLLLFVFLFVERDQTAEFSPEEEQGARARCQAARLDAHPLFLPTGGRRDSRSVCRLLKLKFIDHCHRVDAAVDLNVVTVAKADDVALLKLVLACYPLPVDKGTISALLALNQPGRGGSRAGADCPVTILGHGGNGDAFNILGQEGGEMLSPCVTTEETQNAFLDGENGPPPLPLSELNHKEECGRGCWGGKKVGNDNLLGEVVQNDARVGSRDAVPLERHIRLGVPSKRAAQRKGKRVTLSGEQYAIGWRRSSRNRGLGGREIHLEQQQQSDFDMGTQSCSFRLLEHRHSQGRLFLACPDLQQWRDPLPGRSFTAPQKCHGHFDFRI